MAQKASEEQATSPLQHKTLSAYYPAIFTLRTVIRSFTPFDGGAENSHHAQLLDETWCAFRSRDDHNVLQTRLRVVDRRQEGSQQELIDRILRDIGRSGERNVLLSNNKYPSVDLPINVTRPHVENRHVHGPASVLRNPAWKMLRTRIGDEAFRLIILHTSIFLPLSNNCYTQLSGQPIYDLYDHKKASLLETSYTQKRKKSSTRHTRRKRARPMLDTAPSRPEMVKPAMNRAAAAEVSIARQRMFYGRPARSHNGKPSIGLPPSHMLASLCTGEEVTDAQLLKLLSAILPDMFRPADSDDERIKVKGSLARVEGMLAMAKEMVARYRKLNVRALLSRCTSQEHPSTLPTKLPLTQVCASSLPVTQILLSNPVTSSQGVVKKETATSPQLPPIIKAVPHRQVCRFVDLVIRQLLPVTMMGSQHNSDILLSHVRRFVKAKQYETVTLHAVIQGIQVLDIPWLDITSSGHITATDAHKRVRLAQQFFRWVFDGFLIPLLRNTFYITETATTRYETVYYTHDDWQRTTEPYFTELSRKLLVKLDINQAFFARQGDLGVSAVRFIPKPSGFRPIVNLGRKIKRSSVYGISTNGIHSGGMSANQILKNVHQVLTLEKERHKGKLGASLFGTNEIFAPLQALKTDLLRKYDKIPHLYFVKMDIKAAFDTIKQDKMLDIVSTMMDKNHDYCIMLYCLLLPPASKASQNTARRLFKPRAMVDDHRSTTFGDHASDISEPLRNAVVVDLVRRKQVSRAECLDLLRTHIRRNVWQLGKTLYRQKTGIPQGSKISSLLCSFFYAHMENEYLKFTTKPGSCLMRYIDDFLFVTDDLPTARRFVSTMSRGFPAYGAEVSMAKTLVSFECESGGLMAPVMGLNEYGQGLFPYCGFLIDTKSLDVTSDYPRVMTGPIRQSFAMRSQRHRGANFVGWFSRQLENRNHVAYLDTKHNSLDNVHFNIFLNFALTALKLPHYFKTEDLLPSRERLIADALCASAEYTFVAGRARVRHASRHKEDGAAHYSVLKADFIFLAVSAIVRVLRRKASKFARVLPLLELELKGGRYKGMEARHALVLKRGWHAVKDAQF
ncbi:hypothetical protein IAU60_005191 [Kwoniella sp. DSM 27419]